MTTINLKDLQKVMPYKWRVQSKFSKGGKTMLRMLAYVDARQVTKMLDEVVGAKNWQDKYYEVKGTLFCSIGIRMEYITQDNRIYEWVWKTDAGVPSKMSSQKGEASDAFKRAAVKWGINREAYNMELVELKTKNYNNKPYPIGEDGKFLKGQAINDYCNKIAEIKEIVEEENEDNSSNNLA